MKYIYDKEIFSQLNKLINKNNYSSIYVLTDENTQTHCLGILEDKLNSEFTNVNIKAGDKNKNLESLKRIWDQLLESGGDRKSLMINLGGGVVTDIGGFAAVTFKRGIDFIHIPTSLLGMVDAAIGGKNGINYNIYKNQIGSIVPPSFVLIYPLFLQTLPRNEFMSGFAEMLKHGLIADKQYWKDLLAYIHRPVPEKLSELIKKSVEIKDTVITSDPYEKGLRKILNFGHTLGHAIESYINYSKNQSITHGHAVAIGMILVAYLSVKLTGLSEKEANTIKTNLKELYPVIDFNKEDVRQIIELLKYDKKNEKGKINFILLESIGKPVLDRQVDNELIYKSFEYYLGLAEKR